MGLNCCSSAQEITPSFSIPCKMRVYLTENTIPPRFLLKKQGYVRVPYWSALDYLTAVAKLSGELKGPSDLANKVMTVLRSVMNWRDPRRTSRGITTTRDIVSRGRYWPWFRRVPLQMPILNSFRCGWASRFERMLVSTTLAGEVLKRFLADFICKRFE